MITGTRNVARSINRERTAMRRRGRLGALANYVYVESCVSRGWCPDSVGMSLRMGVGYSNQEREPRRINSWRDENLWASKVGDLRNMARWSLTGRSRANSPAPPPWGILKGAQTKDFLCLP